MHLSGVDARKKHCSFERPTQPDFEAVCRCALTVQRTVWFPIPCRSVPFVIVKYHFNNVPHQPAARMGLVDHTVRTDPTECFMRYEPRPPPLLPPPLAASVSPQPQSSAKGSCLFEFLTVMVGSTAHIRLSASMPSTTRRTEIIMARTNVCRSRSSTPPPAAKSLSGRPASCG